ncbi:MAG TPA: iron-containing alcohol dehydrogenase [Bacilli bacterium]|jgi:alcohol dehydrogenase YqhD (iron-dependent ADH family)|nr:iron-containing alcohol dehydrogenase [Bacilli bacterium]HOM32094.1 iron-containing alcohol dehydrogenase [Bacilli bacterium]
MHSFNLKIQTELIFGNGRHTEVGSIIKRYGKKNVIILYGQNHAVRSGLLEAVTNALDAENIDYVLYGGITPNPEVFYVREAKAIAKEYAVDFILAIGGGSVIDVAKSLSVNFYYEGDALDFSKRIVTPKKALPLGVILTHASAGSEMSASCVISDSTNNFKQGFRNDLVRPLFAITNPELTYSVSMYQTAVGIVDTFMHSLERYFNKSDKIELADRFAEAIFVTLRECAETLIADPLDETARANLMLASTFSHNDVTSMGKKANLVVHTLEHALSALYPSIAHGHGLAVLYPAWLFVYFEELKEKLDRFARVVFNLHHEDIDTNAKEGILALKELFMRLGLTTTLSSLGIKREDIPTLADIVTENGTKELYHDQKNLTRYDIIKLYESCF